MPLLTLRYAIPHKRHYNFGNHIDFEILYDILQHEVEDIKDLYEQLLNVIEENP